MVEKRNLGRHRKRFSIRFGINETIRTAFTEDISTTGLFIKTPYVYKVGSLILVDVSLDQTRTVRLEARVMWSKKVPPQMIHLVKKSGMGVQIVRFVRGEADYCELCEELALPYAEVL